MVQYRLGYLGFYSSGDDCCPGNLGLWDQTEALKWVQSNIAGFSGDKVSHSESAVYNTMLRTFKSEGFFALLPQLVSQWNEHCLEGI